MNFAAAEKARAAAWKASTDTLPAQARVPAAYIDKDGPPSPQVYEHCLPVEFAAWSLLPAVREPALELFSELGIPWHAGIGLGPSNNLMSSQVQCVNALGQMVSDPGRLVRAFAVPLGTVEPMQIEPGRYLTFEYIGPTDFFGEARDGVRTRGAGCTSVDAAFLHRNADGVVELILMEWKYIESYRRRHAEPRRDAIRRRRYRSTFEDPEGPLRSQLAEMDTLFQEPLYQLMRQQLLAYRLERAHADGCQRVRVVHVLSPANTAYQRSLHEPAAKMLGRTVHEVWARLLRHRDQFVSLDPALFLDPEVTCTEYVNRYGARP